MRRLLQRRSMTAESAAECRGDESGSQETQDFPKVDRLVPKPILKRCQPELVEFSNALGTTRSTLIKAWKSSLVLPGFLVSRFKFEIPIHRLHRFPQIFGLSTINQRRSRSLNYQLSFLLS